jgi:hypothetical protein
VCSLRVWVGVLCSCRLRLSWVGFGGLLSFFFWAVFLFPALRFSLVYCRCTKGRLTLLIKSVYYLSKKNLLSIYKFRRDNHCQYNLTGSMFLEGPSENELYPIHFH